MSGPRGGSWLTGPPPTSRGEPVFANPLPVEVLQPVRDRRRRTAKEVRQDALGHVLAAGVVTGVGRHEHAVRGLPRGPPGAFACLASSDTCAASWNRISSRNPSSMYRWPCPVWIRKLPLGFPPNSSTPALISTSRALVIKNAGRRPVCASAKSGVTRLGEAAVRVGAEASRDCWTGSAPRKRRTVRTVLRAAMSNLHASLRVVPAISARGYGSERNAVSSWLSVT